MKRLFLVGVTLLTSANLSSHPFVLRGHQISVSATNSAHAGDQLIASQSKLVDPHDPESRDIIMSATAYRRDANGQWSFEQDLISEFAADFQEGATKVAMTPTLAAIQLPSGLHIFRRASTAWVEDPIDVTAPLSGFSIDVEGGTVVATEFSEDCSPRVRVLNRASNGHWRVAADLPAPTGACVASVDLDKAAVIFTTKVGSDFTTARVHIFESSGSGWLETATFASADSREEFGRSVAVHGALALASGSQHGTHIYRRGAGGWAAAGLLEKPDATDGKQTDSLLQISDDKVLAYGNHAYLFRDRTDHPLELLADLNAAGDTLLSGNRVIYGSFGPLSEIDLPSSYAVPALVQDDFETGEATQWTPQPGSDFTVATSGNTHVYRQSSLTGDAVAIHSSDLKQQAISLDIVPTAFNGADRWVGVMVRYQDPANFYYLTLRNSRRIALKRMVNGVSTELASGLMDVTVGQRYQITLECVAAQLNVYINGMRSSLTAYDAALSHGHPGLRTYEAKADFDNIVISGGPLASLAHSNVATNGSAWAEIPDNPQQSSLEGAATMVTGLPRRDAVVQADLQVNEFAAAGSSWAGLLARYVDAGNYYYVTMRGTKELSLRKLSNGAITVLATVPFPATSGEAIRLRLEAIGDRLRVYANGQFLIESVGAEIAAGQVGVMTYRAKAGFNRYTAYEP